MSAWNGRAVRLYHIHPRIVRLDAAYWGLCLIGWIHSVLGAVTVIPWNPKRQKNRSCLPPTWTKEELGKRSAIERFFGRVLLFFHLQHKLYLASKWKTIHSLARYNLCCKLILTEHCQITVLFAIEPSLDSKKRSQPDGTDQ